MERVWEWRKNLSIVGLPRPFYLSCSVSAPKPKIFREDRYSDWFGYLGRGRVYKSLNKKSIFTPAQDQQWSTTHFPYPTQQANMSPNQTNSSSKPKLNPNPLSIKILYLVELQSWAVPSGSQAWVSVVDSRIAWPWS